MKYNFDKIANLANTNSYRYLDLKEGELNLTIADMDFMILPEIEEALNNRIHIKAYPYNAVPEQFFTSFISFQKKRHSNEIVRQQLLFSTSVIASLDAVLDATLNQGDKVLMFTPIYNTFYSCLNNHKLEIISCPFLIKGNEYQIDFPLLNRLIKENDIKLFLLSNPHNPGGKIFSKEEVELITRLAKENDILLLSDEIHCDITDPDKEFYSFVHCFLDYKNIIVLSSASKSFNLAGMQCSIVIIDNKLLREKIRDQLYKNDVGEPNCFGPYASIAAWENGLEYNKQLREYLKGNKDYLSSFDFEKKYCLKLIDGGSTFLLWYKVPPFFLDGDEFADLFYKEEGIKVSPGSIFGLEGQNFVRINIATNRENINKLAVKLDKFLSSHQKAISK